MFAHAVVNLSEGVAPSARLQNRTGKFPFIRLLNDRVFGKDTVDTSRVSFIMTMSVEQEFVAEFFAASFALWSNVVNFNDISVLKEQLTPATFPLLLSQEHSLDAVAEGMCFESLAPVEQVAIVRAGRSLDFDVSLDMRLSVFPQFCLLALKLPALSFIHMPVFVRDPMPSLVGMAALRPPF